MKILACVFAIVALARVSQGQTTTISPPFTPTTTCGTKAVTCYRTQYAALNKYMGMFNFVEGCKMVKTVFQCIDNIGLSDTSCGPSSGNTEMQATRTWILNDQGGVCNADGSVTPCGNDAHTCLVDFAAVLSYLEEKNLTAACPMLTNYKTCIANLQASTECSSDNLKTTLNTIEGNFAEFTLLANCEGPCAQKIGVCSENSTLTFQQIGIPNFCTNAAKAVACVTALETDPVCKSSQNDVVAVVQAEKAHEVLQSDLCTSDGKVAPCASGIAKCSEDLKQITSNPNAPNDQLCKAAATFEQCIAADPCTNDLKSLVDTMKSDMQTEEMKKNCPTVGSCSDRLKACEQVLTPLQTGGPSQTNDQICTVVVQALSCFDTVRADPVCIEDKYSVSDYERLVRNSSDTTCSSMSDKTACAYRLVECEESLFQISDTNTPTPADCLVIQNTVKCFDKVRTDSTCSAAKTGISNFEKQVKKVVGSQCGGGGIVIQSSLLLILAALIVSIKGYF